MAHTKYLALLRYITQVIQSASKNLQINQWDFNYNSRTFDQLKVYDNIKPYPKGIINLNSIEKLSAHSNVFTYDNLMRGAEINGIIDSIDIAEVYKKYKIYGLIEWYKLSIDVTLYLETGVQLLDFATAWNSKFPVNKITVNNEYNYFVQIPGDLLKDFDPERDMSYNIYVSMQDDASNFNYFSRIVSSPLIRPLGISQTQDKKSENHSININLEITDFVLSNLVSVDIKRWKRVFTINFQLAVEDFSHKIEKLRELESELPENERGNNATIYDSYKPLKMIIPAFYTQSDDWNKLINFISDNKDIEIYIILKDNHYKSEIKKAGAQVLYYVNDDNEKDAQNKINENLDWDGFFIKTNIVDYIKDIGSYFVVYKNNEYIEGCDAVLFLEENYNKVSDSDYKSPKNGAAIVYEVNTQQKFDRIMDLMTAADTKYIYLDSNPNNNYSNISQWLVNYKTYSVYGYKRETEYYPKKVNYDNDKD